MMFCLDFSMPTDSILKLHQRFTLFLLFLFCQQLQKHLMFLAKQELFAFNEKILEFYKSGVVYLSGRDKQYRPTLVINLFNYNKILHTQEIFFHSIFLLCVLMEDYYFYDAAVENWIVFIDIGDRCFIDFNLDSATFIIERMQVNFPQTVEKIFLISPSLSMQLSWSQIESLFTKETKQKIKFIKQKEYLHLIKRYYDPMQLEKKYGGKMEDFTVKQFWPPWNSISEQQFQEEEVMQQQKVQQAQQIAFSEERKSSEEEDKKMISFQIYPKDPEYDFSMYPKEWAEKNQAKTVQPYRNTHLYQSKVKELTEEEKLKLLHQHSNYPMRGRQTLQTLAFEGASSNVQRNTGTPSQFDSKLPHYVLEKPENFQTLGSQRPTQQNNRDDNYQVCEIF